MHAAAGKNIHFWLLCYVREQGVNSERAVMFKNVYKYSER